MAKVKKGLPGLTSDQVKAYLADGYTTIEGIRLDEGDLVVKRSVAAGSGGSANVETNTDSDVLVLLDCEIYPDLAHEGVAREIINRVQRLRKKAGLQPTDDVRMEYKVLSDPENIGLAEVFHTQAAAFQKTLRRPMDKHETTIVEGEIPSQPQEGVIAEEEQEVQHATFLLRLLKL